MAMWEVDVLMVAAPRVTAAAQVGMGLDVYGNLAALDANEVVVLAAQQQFEERLAHIPHALLLLFGYFAFGVRAAFIPPDALFRRALAETSASERAVASAVQTDHLLG